MRKRKWTALALALAFVLGTWTVAGGAPSASAASAPVRHYDGNHYAPETIGAGDEAGQKFAASGPFYSVAVRAPSYGDNDGSLTMKLYAWNSDYATTVASAPVASWTFVDFQDNEWLRLNFPEQPAGQYVWTLSGAVGWVGVWKLTDSTDPAEAFWNGAPTSGDYEGRIYYADADPYLYDGNAYQDVTIGASDTAGSRFTARDRFYSLAVRTPSYSDNDGSLTLKLYAWNTDYATSIGGTPLVSKAFTDFADNAWIRIQFPEKAAGQYVWTLSGASGWVGVWKLTDSGYPATAYFNGSETSGDYQARLYYGEYGTEPQEMYSHVDTTVRDVPISGAGSAGERFQAVWPFTRIETNTPSYGDDQGSLTLSLYAWNADYATTVAGAPIAEKTFVDFADNAWLALDVPEQSAGDYLWVLSGGTNGVGVWQTSGNNFFPGTPYIDGAVASAYGDFKSRITYTPSKVLPDLPVFSSSDAATSETVNRMFKTLYTLKFGPSPVDGNPQTNWMQWDAMTTAWMNTGLNKGKYGADYNEVLREHLLNDVRMTDDGYVYVLNPTNWWGEGTSLVGWPFPSTSSPDDPAVHKYAFGTSVSGWTTSVASHAISGGKWVLQTTGADPFVVSPVQNTPASRMPYLYVQMSSTNADSSGKIYFTTDTDPTWNEAKSVAFTVDTTGASKGYQIPMFKNPHWTGTIKQYRIDPADSGQPGGQVGLERVAGEYDTRHVQTNTAFVLGSAELFLWNPSDVTYLQGNIFRMRTALQFLKTEFDSGSNHYLTIPWVGHEGTSGVDMTKPNVADRYVHGKGVGSNYWDILPIGYKDFYDTIYYYEALKTMAQIEKLIEDNPGWSIAANPYGDDSASLSAKAANVAAAMTGSSSPFWNAATGRYVPSVDTNGAMHDYGYTFVNLEALAQGLADPTRAASIFSWLDGTRTVVGDTSTGADIYAPKFAARASTKRNTEWYNIIWTQSDTHPFGTQVQDGGAIMYVSYYDVMARLKYKSADDAWSRFAAILEHYEEAQEEGGYRSYYGIRGVGMQGDGSAGGIGIDAEFTESALVPLAFLYGFLGINTDKDGFAVAPRRPSALGWMKVEKLAYDGAEASVYASATETSVTIDSSSGPKKLKVGSLTPGTAYQVKRDGAAWETFTADADGVIRFSATGAGAHVYRVEL